MQPENVAKVCNRRQKSIGHVFAIDRAGFCNGSGRFPGTFLSTIGYILGVSGDFPYLRRCVLAGPKREPSKHSLWEKSFDFLANLAHLTPFSLVPRYAEQRPHSFSDREARMYGSVGLRCNHPKIVAQLFRFCLLASYTRFLNS